MFSPLSSSSSSSSSGDDREPSHHHYHNNDERTPLLGTATSTPVQHAAASALASRHSQQQHQTEAAATTAKPWSQQREWSPSSTLTTETDVAVVVTPATADGAGRSLANTTATASVSAQETLDGEEIADGGERDRNMPPSPPSTPPLPQQPAMGVVVLAPPRATQLTSQGEQDTQPYQAVEHTPGIHRGDRPYDSSLAFTAPLLEFQQPPSSTPSHDAHRPGDDDDDNHHTTTMRTNIRAMTRAAAHEAASLISPRCCVAVFMLVGSLGAAGYMTAHIHSSTPVTDFCRYFVFFFLGVPVFSGILLVSCFFIYCGPCE